MHRHCFHGLAPSIHLCIFLQMPQVLKTVTQVWCSTVTVTAMIAHLGIHPWVNSLSPNSKSPWKSLEECCITFAPKRSLRGATIFAEGVEATVRSLIKV